MFSCQSCLASALRAVIHDVSPAPSRLARRQNTTRAIHTSRHRTNGEVAALNYGVDRHTSYGAKSSGIEEESKPALKSFKPSHLRNELRWLSDPLKFNVNTKALLSKGQEEKALQLMRLVGQKNSVTVSWNHILQYNMQKGRVNQAMKLFNEMKKRAQKPDAFTYTILLKGLARNTLVPTALDRALSLYLSMTATNSPVRPTLIHTNAVLQVCGKLGAMDKIFEIASTLPKTGHGAPDHITFATILHSMRVDTMNHNLRFGKGDHKAALQRCNEVIFNGKRIWEDVIERWTAGSITIDEQLVCAMARILMLSSSVDRKEFQPENVDEILSLFEQVMGVPRQFPRLPLAREGETALPMPEADETAEVDGADDPAESEGATPTTMQQLDRGDVNADGEAQFVPIDQKSVFDPVPTKDGEIRAYAKPGNNSLSVIVTACAYLRQYNAAVNYWDQLETVVQPDQENCHSLLRVFRISRKSRHALVIVKKMRQSPSTGGYGVGVQAKTFRIAMSACVRDNKNPNVLDTALQLVKNMRESLDVPDVETMISFCGLLKARGRESNVRYAIGSLEVLYSVLKDARANHYYGGIAIPELEANPEPAPELELPETELQDGNEQQSQYLTPASAPGTTPGGDHFSTTKILELVNAIESVTARALDYYTEDLSPKSRVIWIQNMKKLRKWQRKLESQERGELTKRHSKRNKIFGGKNGEQEEEREEH